MGDGRGHLKEAAAVENEQFPNVGGSLHPGQMVCEPGAVTHKGLVHTYDMGGPRGPQSSSSLHQEVVWGWTLSPISLIPFFARVSYVLKNNGK